MKKCAVAVTGRAARGRTQGFRRSGASTIGTYLPGRATSLTDIVAPEIFNYWNRSVVSQPPADENVANYVSRLSYLTAEDSPP
jgi:hypothetical protein